MSLTTEQQIELIKKHMPFKGEVTLKRWSYKHKSKYWYYFGELLVFPNIMAKIYPTIRFYGKAPLQFSLMRKPFVTQSRLIKRDTTIRQLIYDTYLIYMKNLLEGKPPLPRLKYLNLKTGEFNSMKGIF